MSRPLSGADKAIIAVTHAGAVLKAVLDLKRFQREHDAKDALRSAATLFNETQQALLLDILTSDAL